MAKAPALASETTSTRFPPMEVTIGGQTFEVQISKGDAARVERANGGDISVIGGVMGTINLMHAAMLRMGRLGTLPAGVEIPADFEDFLDVVDFDIPEVASEGKAKG